MNIGSLILFMVAGVMAVNIYGLGLHPSAYVASGFLAGMAIYIQRKPSDANGTLAKTNQQK